MSDHVGKHPDGVEAYKQIRATGGSMMDAVEAFFNAEPAAKAAVKQSKFYLAEQQPQLSGPGPEKVAEIIRSEEEKYIEMLGKAPKLLRKMVSDPSKIDGELLAKIHHTYGYDPSVVEAVYNIQLPSSVHDAYLEAYERHKQTGKAGKG